MVGALDADLEGVPDGEVARRLGAPLVRLEDALLDEGARVELVVVVQPHDARRHAVHVTLPGDVVPPPPRHHLPHPLGLAQNSIGKSPGFTCGTILQY